LEEVDGILIEASFLLPLGRGKAGMGVECLIFNPHLNPPPARGRKSWVFYF
jgi:hypothetical protein